MPFAVIHVKVADPGSLGRISGPKFHGFTAVGVFFPSRFNQTTHLQYHCGKRGPWLGFNCRYSAA